MKKINSTKTDGNIDFNNDYLILMQHPVTTEYFDAKRQINETIKAVKILVSKGIQIFWLWPNIVAGSDYFSKEIRKFREGNKNIKNILFYKNFTPEEYACILKNSSCILGNSSSGIREASYLGIPSVNIGNRQSFRETGKNVVNVDYSSKNIIKAVLKQFNKNLKKIIFMGMVELGRGLQKYYRIVI